MPKTQSSSSGNKTPAKAVSTKAAGAVAPVAPVVPTPVVPPVAPILPTPPVTPVAPTPTPTPLPTPIPTPIPVPTPVSTSVPLTPSSPSTSTTAPTSSVSVTVPNTTGKVTFSLVVTDNLGVESAPAYATVTIQGPPVAVIAAKPPTVAVGGAIQLSGSGSTSAGGTIASYKFSLVPSTSSTNA